MTHDSGLAIRKAVPGNAYVANALNHADEFNEKGTLAVMVSGPRHQFELIEPALAAIGRLFFNGEPGAAQTMKLVNNLLSATAPVATSEAERPSRDSARVRNAPSPKGGGYYRRAFQGARAGLCCQTMAPTDRRKRRETSRTLAGFRIYPAIEKPMRWIVRCPSTRVASQNYN